MINVYQKTDFILNKYCHEFPLPESMDSTNFMALFLVD